MWLYVLELQAFEIWLFFATSLRVRWGYVWAPWWKGYPGMDDSWLLIFLSTHYYRIDYKNTFQPAINSKAAVQAALNAAALRRRTAQNATAPAPKGAVLPKRKKSEVAKDLWILNFKHISSYCPTTSLNLQLTAGCGSYGESDTWTQNSKVYRNGRGFLKCFGCWTCCPKPSRAIGWSSIRLDDCSVYNTFDYHPLDFENHRNVCGGTGDDVNMVSGEEVEDLAKQLTLTLSPTLWNEEAVRDWTLWTMCYPNGM